MFDNTWLTYCLLIAIFVFFLTTFVAVVYTYFAAKERTELRNTRKSMEDTALELEKQEDELFDLKQHYTQQIDRINRRLN